MIRNIKALGLTVFAVIAMGTLSAATASAEKLFHAEVGHPELRAEQHAGEGTLGVNAGTVRCSHVTYSGTQTTATAATLTMGPAYTGCKAFGFVNTTIDVNGCGYEFSITGTPVSGAAPGAVTIECPLSHFITVTAFNCWVTVGPQTRPTGVTYTNLGAGKTRDVTIDVNLTGLTYTQHSKSFPGCTNGTFTNGTYVGATTVRGFNTTNEQIGVWVN
ncbi:MAG TPA: hypothetical protein VF255_11250 [Solirubrobacterales bacterium]